MDNYISKNLRRFRKERGMTQDELAKKLGVSFQSVSKWEQGKSNPDLAICQLITFTDFYSVCQYYKGNEHKYQ